MWGAEEMDLGKVQSDRKRQGVCACMCVCEILHVCLRESLCVHVSVCSHVSK